MDKATVLSEGTDIAIIACGEMTGPAKKAVELLKNEGKTVTLLDMYCVKPVSYTHLDVYKRQQFILLLIQPDQFRPLFLYTVFHKNLLVF